VSNFLVLKDEVNFEIKLDKSILVHSASESNSFLR